MNASSHKVTDEIAKSSAKVVGSKSNTNKKKKSEKIFACDICNISKISWQNLKSHETGRKHLNRLKKKEKMEKKKSSNNNKLKKSEKTSVNSRDINTNQSLQGGATLNISHRSENYLRNDYNHHDYHSKTYRSHKKHSYGKNNHDHYNNLSHQSNPNQFNKNSNRNHGWQPWHNNDMTWDERNRNYPTYQGTDSRYNPVHYDQNGYPFDHRPGYEEWYQNSEEDNDIYYSVNNIYHNVAILENCENSHTRSVSIKLPENPGLKNDAENHQVTKNILELNVNETENAHENVNSTEQLKEKSACENLNSSAEIAEDGIDVSSIRNNSSDTDKHLEKRNVLSENMTGKRIAHWIKPSNMKDKAEVMKLVNEFSKSKKKENLLRLKLQADSVTNENSYDEKEVSSNESFISPSSNFIQESDNCTVQSLSSDMTADESSKNYSKIASTSKRKKCPKSNTESASKSIDHRAKKVRRKSSNSSQGSSISANAFEVSTNRKRKNSLQSNGSGKTHQCSSAECLEACINEVATGGGSWNDAKDSTELNANRTNPEKSSVHTSDASNLIENVLQVPVKQEIFELEGGANQLHPSILEAVNMTEMAKKQLAENASSANETTLSPVESLINLFASGDIRVKKEFDDPIIDILRTVDPAVLDRVCERQPSTMTQSASLDSFPVQNSSVTNNNANSQNSSVTNNNANSRQKTTASADPVSLPNESSISNLQSLKSSLSDILNEIQSISSLEDKVKKKVEKSDCKIQEYQALLDEWKLKKLKYISEEEVLRKNRNDLLKTMTDLLTQHNSGQSSTNTDIANDSSMNTKSIPPIYRNPSNESNKRDAIPLEDQRTSDIPLVSQAQNTSIVILPNDKLKEDSEEIAILPVPQKKNSDIPIIVLDDRDSNKEDQNVRSLQTEAILEKFSGERDVIAHTVSINSILVYEEFLYTCSNDSTAKRFDLRDYTKTVTYVHQKKNVIQLSVAKIRDTSLVFTISSGSKQISSYKAEDGTLLKTFSFTSLIASICKGKGLVYAGLRNGSIVACNWKDYKEIVNINEALRSIDTTYQGGLNVLVTLSNNGNVSIRDADRNGLLIRYVKARTFMPLFMTVCSDSIYLSSAGVLTVLDITTGLFVTKYSFAAAYTSLAVYGDTIFTASFSGLVRCYSKEEEKEVKMYYGAGNDAITCINVHHGWVFTGNRAGQVSAFKYDPVNAHPCKIGNCDFLFPRLEDLEFHILSGKDHDLPAPGSMCSWRKCPMHVPKNCSKETIQAHMRTHFTL